MSFLRNLLGGAPRIAPVGIDLGSSLIKFAQCGLRDGRPCLVAADGVRVPDNVRADPQKRIAFFADAVGDVLKRGGFRGREAVVAVPASLVHLDRLRLSECDEAGIAQAVKWESVDKLPFHPSQAMLRHWVAGQVYEDERPHSEVIIMAARRPLMDKLLAAGAAARLSIVGIQPEPLAALACLIDRATNSGGKAAKGADDSPGRTRAVVDVGRGATRVYIASGTHIQFARSLDIGGDAFNAAVAGAVGIPSDQAPALRARLNAFAPVTDPALRPIEDACHRVLHALLRELDLSFRYHATTFAGSRIDEVKLIGGDPMPDWLARELTAALGVPAEAAQPLPDMRQTETCGVADVPTPAWSVAVGLSLGALGAPAAARAG